MTPEDITVADLVKMVIAIGVGLIGYLGKRELDRVGVELANKADKEQAKSDKEQAQREIGELKMKLEQVQEARERDMERLERTNAEKFAEFTASVRDRITTMERNVDGKLDMLERGMGDKLDMILKVMDGLRKE